MNWLNRYYGKGAQEYDAARSKTLRWAKEQVAVDNFVNRGPVLDVPIGTGRYAGIYEQKALSVVGVDISPDMLAEAKRNCPAIDVRQGDIFALPFEDKSFGTVVCTRMLDWFRPEEMEQAVAEIKRVAHELVVSIRYGEKEEWQINQTHDLNRFLAQLDGLHIAARTVTETGKYGTEEILHLRPAYWGDVLEQFKFHGNTPGFELQRVARVWIKDVHLFDPYQQHTKAVSANVRAEHWPVERLAGVIAEMAADYDCDLPDMYRYKTSAPPRNHDGPVTLLTAEQRTIVLDGRRRINHWHRQGEVRKSVLHITA